jgi:hypothetical protein
VQERERINSITENNYITVDLLKTHVDSTIAGFFQNYIGGGIFTAPILDGLINDSWELV